MTNPTCLIESKLSAPTGRCVPGILLAGLMVTAANTARAEDATAPPPESRVHALVSFEFADKYLTPRGMIVENRELSFQPLVLGFVNVYKDSDTFINDVTLVPGVWNNFQTRQSHGSLSTEASSWNEIDPIAGVSMTIAKNLTWSETYTAFQSQNGSFPTSQHLESKLAFDDSSYLKQCALHPYFIYWQELDNKATDAKVPNLVNPTTTPNNSPGPSFYFDIGITPSYTIEKIKLKLEAPCRVLLPDNRFYGEYYAKSSTVGLWEVGLKGTVPMDFMPQGYGHWSFHAGVKYMSFEDKNLQNLQTYLSPGHPVKDTYQIYAGVSTFF